MDEERELVEVTCPGTLEPMLAEAEDQVMQAPSREDPEETPLKQTAEESCTATTVEWQTIGRMSVHTYQTSNSNSFT